jgi:cytochrome c oxidase assembly factor CtaG
MPDFILWNWSIGLILAAVVAMAGYLWINRFNNIGKTISFMSGLILTELALALPLGPVAPGFSANPLSCCLPGGVLMSMHMIRSMILLLIVPPLIVAGLPKKAVQQFISRLGIERFVKKISNPILTWIIGLGVMWVWHIPPVYNFLTNYSSGIAHVVLPQINVLSLLIGGMFLVWPILAPIEEYRVNPLKGGIYLFLTCTGCSVLGMIMAFASPGFYQTAFAARPAGALIWVFSQQADQALGGLIMWVPGCILCVIGILGLLARYFASYTGATTATTSKLPKSLDRSHISLN